MNPNMTEFLTKQEQEILKKQHRQEKNRRVADRIKAVLLADKGWTYRQIAEALFLDEQTVGTHIDEYIAKKKLTIDSGGSLCKLCTSQIQELLAHLEIKTYLKISEICVYVQETYSISYTVAGMTAFMHQNGFSFKKPKGTPAKADPEKQKAFIKYYKNLRDSLPAEEPLLFGDGVHPTMATKVTYGWIKKGTEKPIETTASRTRINLFGTINLKDMSLVIEQYDTINSASITDYLKKLKEHYPTAPKIHLILDQGSYNTSAETALAAEQLGIILHHLPPYSPNLNPIERLWKLTNEKVRNNRFFKSAKEFRQEMLNFFHITWPQISNSMRGRISDNFQTLKPIVSV